MSSWWTGTVLSDAQYIPLVVLGTISSTLSIIGSSCVIYMTSVDLSEKIMHRLVFAMSLSDILASLSFLLSPFLVPSYLDLPGAIGSHISCATVGFFFMSSVLFGCFYICYLSIYYLLVVRWSFRERDFKVHWEILAHSIAIISPLTINIVGLATQSINPIPILNGMCSYATIPWGCNEEGCIRSSHPTAVTLFMAHAMVQVVLSLLSFVCTFCVWRTVSTTLRRSMSYRFQAANQDDNDERQKQVSTQAILYSLAYFNTFFWPVATFCIMLSIPRDQFDAKRGDTGVYVVILLFCALHPLQGAMNFFTFTRPRVNQWMQSEPEKSRIWIYTQVLQSRQPQKRKRNNTMSATNLNNTSQS